MGPYSFFAGAVAIALSLWILKKALQWGLAIGLMVAVPALVVHFFGH